MNAHRGFTPVAMAPLNAITPEQVICHYHYKHSGCLGGQALSSSFFVPVLCISYVDERNSIKPLFHLLIQEILQNQKMNVYHIKRSNRSFLTLQMGQIPGGCSRAQRYPQTVQRQTGNGSGLTWPGERGCSSALFTSFGSRGTSSGTGTACVFPPAMASLT